MTALHTTYLNLIPLSLLHSNLEQELSESALQYQIGPEVDRTAIFSYAFCESYVLIRTQASKFFGLTDSDIASFALEETHNALMNYSTEHKTKFSTLLRTYFNRRLFAETYKLGYHKRKLNTTSVTLEDSYQIVDDGIAIIEILESLKYCGLSFMEYEYCSQVLKTSRNLTDSDIAWLLNMSPSAINRMRKRLEKKINFFGS